MGYKEDRERLEAVLDARCGAEPFKNEADKAAIELREEEIETVQGWWKLNIDCTHIPSDATLEHIAEMIKQGFTEGQIIEEVGGGS